MKHFILGQEICLLPDKALYWVAKEMLIVADVHLGKAGHFRKSGMAIPEAVHYHDLQILDGLIRQTKARHLLFLGDLFHSLPNDGWLIFEQWLNMQLKQGGIEQSTLIVGNHDVHGVSHIPTKLQCQIQYESEGIYLTHEPMASVPDGSYNLSGHLHPAIQLKGKGRQRLRLPCFYFGKKQGHLPAFGKFTGTMLLNPKGVADIFVVAEDRVLPFPT